LSEEALELLDPVDERECHPARALAGEPGGAEGGDLVVKCRAQALLHLGGGAVRDHGAQMLERAAERHRRGRRRGGEHKGCGRSAVQDPRQQPAEEDEARDADARGNEAEQHLDRERPAHAAHHLPKTLVEIHRPPPLARA